MIKQIPSPNFSKGRKQPINMVVIHIMAGTLVGTDNWFSQKISKASAHYGVGFNGDIHQYVQDTDTAWHAGVIKNPSVKIQGNPNDYSIGIECEGTDLSKAPISQINTLIELIKGLCDKYNIPKDRQHIIGHYEVNSVTRANCPATDKSILDTIVNKVKGNVCPTCGQLVV